MRHEEHTRTPVLAFALAGLGIVALLDAVARRTRVDAAPSAATVFIVAGTDGSPMCQPDPVVMNGKGPITWIIDEALPQFTFPPTGAIVFDTGKSSFAPPERMPNKANRVVTVDDLHSQLGVFKYTVNLLGPGNPSIDPRVHNNSGLVSSSPPPILDQLLNLLLGPPHGH